MGLHRQWLTSISSIYNSSWALYSQRKKRPRKPAGTAGNISPIARMPDMDYRADEKENNVHKSNKDISEQECAKNIIITPVKACIATKYTTWWDR